MPHRESDTCDDPLYRKNEHVGWVTFFSSEDAAWGVHFRGTVDVPGPVLSALSRILSE